MTIRSFSTVSITFALVVSLITGIVTPFAVPVASADTDPCSAPTAGKSQTELQVDLDACNADIAKWTDILNSTKKTTANYKTEVQILTAKINAAASSIKAKNIAIASLVQNINLKQSKINDLTSKVEAGKQSLAALLRKTKEIDSYSLADAVLSTKNFSDFYADVDSYASTQRALAATNDELRGVQATTESEKEALDKERQAEADAKAAIETAKAQVEASQAEQKKLLAQSQNQEQVYGQVVADKQARAAQIRVALFSLRDTGAIQFGQALQYAQAAQTATGIDPAFLLAILTQESNLGQNVGACYVTNPATGDGIGANTGTPKSRVMSPTRDVPIFQDILSHTGGDMASTRVSCWQPIYSSAGNPIGWGGAMGPAQFIPSTWKLFAPRIQKANGGNYPNPWSARDAFMAAAIYLTDLGANGGYSAQKNAACKYYSGSSCSTSYAATYGNSVMAKAASIQTNMIDPLQGV